MQNQARLSSISSPFSSSRSSRSFGSSKKSPPPACSVLMGMLRHAINDVFNQK